MPFENDEKCFLFCLKSFFSSLIILRTKRAFDVTQKAFFIIFKGVTVAENCLRPESVPLKSQPRTHILQLMFHILLPLDPQNLNRKVHQQPLISVNRDSHQQPWTGVIQVIRRKQ